MRKFQMRHFLLAKSLWGHVDGSETLAVDATDVLQTDFRLKAREHFLP